MKKKGLSAVITTLIIVLLVLVAVGVVWVVIANLITSGAEEISLGKFTLNMEIKNVEVKDDGTVDVKVKRNAGKGELSGIKFLINDGVEVHEFTKETTVGELGQRTFNLNYAGAVKEVSIAPIFELESGKESLGNEIDKEELPKEKIVEYLNDFGDADDMRTLIEGESLNGVSCLSLFEEGLRGDGIYYIDPDGSGGEEGLQVYCDMTTDGGGWTRFLKYSCGASPCVFPTKEEWQTGFSRAADANIKGFLIKTWIDNEHDSESGQSWINAYYCELLAAHQDEKFDDELGIYDAPGSGSHIYNHGFCTSSSNYLPGSAETEHSSYDGNFWGPHSSYPDGSIWGPYSTTPLHMFVLYSTFIVSSGSGYSTDDGTIEFFYRE